MVDERPVLESSPGGRLYQRHGYERCDCGPHRDRDLVRGVLLPADPPADKQSDREEDEAVLRHEHHEAVQPGRGLGEVADLVEVAPVTAHRYGPFGCCPPGGEPTGSARRRISSSCARAAICCAKSAV